MFSDTFEALKEIMEQATDSQTASSTEMDKLKKRLTTIETDLEEKDKALLDNEEQMLAMTDQIEQAQKEGVALKKMVANFEDMEVKHEEKKAQMLEQMKERSDMIEQLESLKGQADEENAKLQELLAEADQQLRQVEMRIGPLEQENEAMQ